MPQSVTLYFHPPHGPPDPDRAAISGYDDNKWSQLPHLNEEDMLHITLLSAIDVQYSLWIMGQGMLGISIFMGIFYALIYSLEKIFTTKSDQ